MYTTYTPIILRSLHVYVSILCYIFLFPFNDTPIIEIYPLSLHDALPIWCLAGALELLVDDPLVVGDRVPAIGRREADRVGRGLEGAGDRRRRALHALHVVRCERHLGADGELGVLCGHHPSWRWAAIHRVLHIRVAAPIGRLRLL